MSGLGLLGSSVYYTAVMSGLGLLGSNVYYIAVMSGIGLLSSRVYYVAVMSKVKSDLLFITHMILCIKRLEKN